MDVGAADAKCQFPYQGRLHASHAYTVASIDAAQKVYNLATTCMPHDGNKSEDMVGVDGSPYPVKYNSRFLLGQIHQLRTEGLKVDCVTYVFSQSLVWHRTVACHHSFPFQSLCKDISVYGRLLHQRDCRPPWRRQLVCNAMCTALHAKGAAQFPALADEEIEQAS